MSKNKAIPNELTDFFKGDGVFFGNEKIKKPENKPEIIETERANGVTEQTPERLNASSNELNIENNDDEIIDTLQKGKLDDEEKTERYSFEIYPSQKEEIEDFLYQYKKKTGKRLSASKLIRVAIDNYLNKLQNQI